METKDNIMDAVVTKSESLADKMNSLTAKFDLAEELLVDSEDLVEVIEEKTQDVKLLELAPTDIINLEVMTEDFKYVRETLKETTDNGRKVLKVVTLDLLDSDDDKRASLIMSFAELNKSVGDNMKLLIQSYKDLSSVLLNIDKIQKAMEHSGATVNNTINQTNYTEAVNVTELIAKMRSEE